MSDSLVFRGLSKPDLGDARLNRRQTDILGELILSPSKSIPEALRDDAAVEACYRLLRNERVEYREMLKPHTQEVLACDAPGSWLAIHDTTQIAHTTAFDADDVYKLNGKKLGYLAHVSLLVGEQGTRPLGVAHFEAVDRGASDNDPNPYGRSHEARRWERGIEAAAECIQGHPVIHVLDSEGDAYPIFVALNQLGGQACVVRSSGTQRVIKDAEGQCSLLRDALPFSPVASERTVSLSARPRPRPSSPGKGKRNKKTRTSRAAKLSLSARSVVMPRPVNATVCGPESLNLNMVHVWEPSPPDGAEPVSWILWTTLPIETPVDVERIVDIYVARWQIEELFQALKTGCQFEKRRFESRATSARALALYLPMAVHTLLLRFAAREGSDKPAVTYIVEDRLEVLGALVPSMPANPTLTHVAMAVAKLGGHLKSNGTPGWRVLGRGMERWHQSVEAVRAFLAEKKGNIGSPDD